MRIKSRKGTTIVEAAMIFPLVIAGVMAVLYIIIGLYLSLSLQASLHVSIRKECGEFSQTVYRMEESGEYPSQNGSVGRRPVIVMEEEREYRVSGLFTERISRKERGRGYIIDEAETIRTLSLVKEVIP